MKHLIISLVTLLFMSALVSEMQAQNVVITETFDNNELGWTENTKPDLGECIIIDGQLKFNSKLSSVFFNARQDRPTLLTSEAVMPIDPTQGFEISTDISFDHIGSFLGESFDHINGTSGFLLEYDDDYNFIAIAVNESYCYILFYVDGVVKRYKVSAVKMKDVQNKKVTTNLKIKYRDYKLTVLVDGVDMVEIRKVNIESPTFALFTTGKRKVVFDNVVISQ